MSENRLYKESKLPFVSVIIPTHNRRELLRITIASVLNQGYENWELIIVDDGSTDNTKQMILGLNDVRIRYFEIEKKGRSAARNYGYEQIDPKSNYVLFLDSDDQLLCDGLKIQIEFALKSPFASFILGKSTLVDTNGHVLNDGGLQTLSHIPEERNFKPGVILLSSLLCKRSVIDLHPFDTTLDRFEDLNFYRLNLRNENIFIHNLPISKVLTHIGNSLNSIDSVQILNQLRLYVELSGGFRGEQKKGLSKLILYYGLALYETPTELRLVLKLLLLALLYNPALVGNLNASRVRRLTITLIKKILLKMNFLNIPNLKRFKFWFIFKFRLFGKSESVSGPGSSFEETEFTRKLIDEVIQVYSIKSLADAPCGDLFWIADIANSIHEYKGFDIVDALVKRNFLNHPNLEFERVDLVNTVIERFDLILCRDLLVHLSNDEAVKVISNFKKSGSLFLLSTTFPNQIENIDLGRRIWRPLNLEVSPFSLGQPILSNRENSREHPSYSDKSLALWRLN